MTNDDSLREAREAVDETRRRLSLDDNELMRLHRSVFSTPDEIREQRNVVSERTQAVIDAQSAYIRELEAENILRRAFLKATLKGHIRIIEMPDGWYEARLEGDELVIEKREDLARRRVAG